MTNKDPGDNPALATCLRQADAFVACMQDHDRASPVPGTATLVTLIEDWCRRATETHLRDGGLVLPDAEALAAAVTRFRAGATEAKTD